MYVYIHVYIYVYLYLYAYLETPETMVGRILVLMWSFALLTVETGSPLSFDNEARPTVTLPQMLCRRRQWPSLAGSLTHEAPSFKPELFPLKQT